MNARRRARRGVVYIFAVGVERGSDVVGYWGSGVGWLDGGVRFVLRGVSERGDEWSLTVPFFIVRLGGD